MKNQRPPCQRGCQPQGRLEDLPRVQRIISGLAAARVTGDEILRCAQNDRDGDCALQGTQGAAGSVQPYTTFTIFLTVIGGIFTTLRS
jgi:hypothetical protein